MRRSNLLARLSLISSSRLQGYSSSLCPRYKSEEVFDLFADIDEGPSVRIEISGRRKITRASTNCLPRGGHQRLQI